MLEKVLCAFGEMTNEYDDWFPKNLEFDNNGFMARQAFYKEHLKSEKITSYELSQKLKIPVDQFMEEVHLFAMLNPGYVHFSFIFPYLKTAISKQKKINALMWMRDNAEHLTIEHICERLEISEREARKFIKSNQDRLATLPVKSLQHQYYYFDVINNHELQQKVIQYFNTNPYVQLEKCIKDLNLTIGEDALRNGLEHLINDGYKIPCFVSSDPIAEEKKAMEVIAYKEKNMYATPKAIAKKFGLKEGQVDNILHRACEEYRTEKIRSFEMYFKKVLTDIDEIGDLCLERFHASPQSSSRWLEIMQMGLEKKIRMLGLNAPSEIRIQQNVKIQSKEEKDAMIEAYFATEVIDVTPKP